MGVSHPERATKLSVSSRGTSVIAEAILALIMFSWIPIAIKAIESDPLTIGVGRLGIAVGVLTFMFRHRIKLRTIGRTGWLHMMLLGFVFALHWYTYFLSIKLSTAATATIAMSSYGLFLLLFTKIKGHRRIKLSDFLLITLAVSGNILVIPDFSLDNDITLGLLVGISSAALFAMLPLLHQRDLGLSDTQRSYGQFLFAGICFAFALPATDFSLDSKSWLLMGFLGLVGVVAHSMWVRVTTRLSTVATSTIYYIGVPLAMGMSMLMLGEEIASKTWLGAGIIISANLTGLVSLHRRQEILHKSLNHADQQCNCS